MPDEATVAATSLPRTRSGGGGVGLSADAKAALCQAVAIGNIPEAYIASVLNLAGSCGDVVKIEDPVPEDVAAFAKLQQDGCGGRTVLVHFGSGKQAFEAVPALHRAAPGGSGQEQLWCRQVNGEGARVRVTPACGAGALGAWRVQRTLCWSSSCVQRARPFPARTALRSAERIASVGRVAQRVRSLKRSHVA